MKMFFRKRTHESHPGSPFAGSVIVLAGLLAIYAGQAAVSAAGAQSEGGVYTSAQAKRGADAYTNFSCGSCHGDDLAGDFTNPALTGDDFLFFWNGKRAGDLVTRIQTSMPPEDPESLELATVADIVAYILEVNGFPAGSNELPADAAALNGVLIEKE